jgi:hypothetical protein
VDFTRSVVETLQTEARFLLFHRVERDIARREHPLLVLGLVCAVVAGVGRYWDNTRAALWQHMGLGSIAFVFALAGFLWIIMLPLRPRNWRYRTMLLFVGMTAPLGFIYAVPVERFLLLDTAQTVNAWFLAAVILWRVSLLVTHLKRSAGFSVPEGIFATLLPLVVIVAVLTLLNLEKVVFNIMGGITEEQRTGNDLAYEVMVLVTVLSVYAAPVFLTIYGILVWRRRKRAIGPEA